MKLLKNYIYKVPGTVLHTVVGTERRKLLVWECVSQQEFLFTR